MEVVHIHVVNLLFFSLQIFLFLGVLFIAFGVVGFSLKWKQEWPTVLLSLQVSERLMLLQFRWWTDPGSRNAVNLFLCFVCLFVCRPQVHSCSLVPLEPWLCWARLFSGATLQLEINVRVESEITVWQLSPYGFDSFLNPVCTTTSRLISDKKWGWDKCSIKLTLFTVKTHESQVTNIILCRVCCDSHQNLYSGCMWKVTSSCK